MEFLENLYHPDVGGRQLGDLRLYCCGRRTDAPDHSFGPAARDNFWLIYLRQGTGFYEVGSRRYTLEPGMLFVAFPGRRIYYRADPGSVWTIHWVSIGADFLEGYLAAMGITEENPIVRVREEAAAIFDTLLDEIPRETVGSKFACVGLIYRLLALMTPPELTVPVSRDYIDEAIFFLSNNYDRPITVADAAEAVRLDPSYFARLFRQRTGMTPGQWLLDYRLEKAVSLLSRTNLKISEIALSVGFADPLYFSRRFRERRGISPAKWRETKENGGCR